MGPIGAAALAMKLPGPAMFRSSRDFAGRLGLTPKDHSIAGGQRVCVITRGDKTLCRLMVSGAMAIVKYAKPGRTAPWLLALLARKPKKLAAVALANKNACIPASLSSGVLPETCKTTTRRVIVDPKIEPIRRHHGPRRGRLRVRSSIGGTPSGPAVLPTAATGRTMPQATASLSLPL
jgi:Transposase IS116/IS110/IS902 family